MPPSTDEARRLLCALGDHVRDLVVGSRGMDMAAVAGETVADTIYAIDRVADDALVEWFEEHWPGVTVVSEGLDEPVVVGDDPAWTVIVDTIDGTRGLMYDKRPAWCLAAAAPPGGGLADIVAAAMTELPTVKQGSTDQLSATPRRRTASRARRSRRRSARGVRRAAVRRPPTSRTASAAWPSSSCPGKAALAALEAELFDRLGERARLRRRVPLDGRPTPRAHHGPGPLRRRPAPAGHRGGLACHPYDVCTAMLLEEAGGVVTDPWGAPLDVPLDNVSPVAWVGYANEALAARIGPVLAELVDGLRAG